MVYETLRFLLVIAAKVAFVLACAAFLTLVLSRASASVRHLVWAAALGSALLLPLGALVLPEWRLPLLSAPTTSRGQLETLPNTSGTAGLDASPSGAIPSQSASVEEAAWSQLLLFAWIAGVIATTLRLIVGAAGLLWMGRRAGVGPCVEWHALVVELSERLGVTQPVRLLCSATTSMPLSWGWIRPTLLLPASASTWTTDRVRAVLLHELAHVKRCDCLTQLVAQVACAVHWFNPLVWMAAARLRAERERACDDVVLACGTRGSEYATHLLDIARGLHTERLRSWHALAMARPSQLEGRLLAILDPSRPRHALTRRRSAAVGGVAGRSGAMRASPVEQRDPDAGRRH